MPVTAFYAALLTPIFIVLAIRVVTARRSGGVTVGDAGDPVLLRRMRVHANFVEYVPLALVLLGLAEGLGAPAWQLHGLGVVLLVARLSHALGMSRTDEPLALRVAGMAGTFAVLITAALACLNGALRLGVVG
jgi:uncharacterized membrane protein YecN with MAPEG domain